MTSPINGGSRTPSTASPEEQQKFFDDVRQTVLIHLKYEKKPGGHWIIRDLMGLDLVGLASL